MIETISINGEKSLNWREITDDPAHDKIARKKYLDWLLSRRKILKVDLLDFFANMARGKDVLDIGVVEHDESHMFKPEWKHAHISKSAKKCLGVDIISPLVDKLNNSGYRCLCLDATSSVKLDEDFDVVIIGDVIEHVDRPVDLVKFALRQLRDSESRIYISTPNPFYENWRRGVEKEGTFIANFEHVSWITPSNMVEIAHRAGAKFCNYYVPVLGVPRYNPIRRWLTLRKPFEIRAGYFVYELAK